MDVFTSYWQNPRLGGWDGQVVGISRGVPRWHLPYRYTRLPALFPGHELLAGYRAEKITSEQYAPVYLQHLNTLGVEKVISLIESKYDGRPLALVCWCAPSKFCHRHLLAQWLEEQCGFVIQELERG